jgi:hypothetical protein
MSLSDLQLIPNALQIKESLLRISIVFGEHGDGIHSIFNSISTEVVLGGFIVHISTGRGGMRRRRREGDKPILQIKRAAVIHLLTGSRVVTTIF